MCVGCACVSFRPGIASAENILGRLGNGIAQLEADEPETPELSKPASVGQESAESGKHPLLWRVNSTWALVVLSLLVAVIYLIDSGFFDQAPKLDRESAVTESQESWFTV